MRIKQPQNRYQPQPPIEVNKKQSNMNIVHQQAEPKQKAPVNMQNLRKESGQVLVSEGQKQKALKFREKQLSDDVAVRREKMRENGRPVMEGFEEAEAPASYNEIMNKISMMDLPRQYKMNPEEIVRKTSDYLAINILIETHLQMEQTGNIGVNEQAEKPNDYDYYDTQPGQRYMQSMRRNWNSNNRGIRSEDEYQSKVKFIVSEKIADKISFQPVPSSSHSTILKKARTLRSKMQTLR